MPSSNPLRRLARRTPSPLDGVVEYGAGALTDIVEIVKGLPDDPTDTWDPEHIRRTLPWLKAINAAYFRPEVRGLENIPVGEPSLLVGNHSGGLMIADTFVLSAAFYDHFGPDRRFHQLAHDVAAKSPLHGPDPPLRRRPRLARQRARGVQARRARARLPRRRPRDVPAELAQRPDRVRRPPGLRPARARGERPDRARGGDRRAGDGAVPHARRSASPSCSASTASPASRCCRSRSARRSASTCSTSPAACPLPAKITIQVLPPIDLRERFGDSVDADAAYEQVTARDAGDAERAQRGADAARRRLTSGIPMWNASPSTKRASTGCSAAR